MVFLILRLEIDNPEIILSLLALGISSSSSSLFWLLVLGSVSFSTILISSLIKSLFIELLGIIIIFFF